MPEPPKQRKAAALRYEPGEPAPRVTASGAGIIADQIVAAAREAGIPVRSDAALAEALAALDIGADVPEALWVAVAQTLAWAYKLDGRASDYS
jgi:flagellar biosynthesis protein